MIVAESRFGRMTHKTISPNRWHGQTPYSPNTAHEKRPSHFLSPFRYPGGKTWLTPCVRQWLQSTDRRPTEFIEPFAGGGSVGLMVASEGLAQHVTLVERDDQVAAVWRTIIYGDWRWLAERIATFDFTPQDVQAELQAHRGTSNGKGISDDFARIVSVTEDPRPGAGVLEKEANGARLVLAMVSRNPQERISLIAQYRSRDHFH